MKEYTIDADKWRCGHFLEGKLGEGPTNLLNKQRRKILMMTKSEIFLAAFSLVCSFVVFGAVKEIDKLRNKAIEEKAAIYAINPDGSKEFVWIGDLFEQKKEK